MTKDTVDSLSKELDDLCVRVSALEAAEAARKQRRRGPRRPRQAKPTTAETVFNALGALNEQQRKELWRRLRDGA